MASAPQTWAVMQALQYRTFAQVLVGGVSPFSTFSTNPNPQNPNSASDLTRYGTNPNGTVTSAIYIGVPKDWTTLYPQQCHIIPALDEHVFWEALGGKVWDIQEIYVRILFRRHDDWFGSLQTFIATRDALYASLAQHARLAGASTVSASRIDQPRHGPPAYHLGADLGDQWHAWGVGIWVRQEWFAPTGIGD